MIIVLTDENGDTVFCGRAAHVAIETERLGATQQGLPRPLSICRRDLSPPGGRKSAFEYRIAERGHENDGEDFDRLPNPEGDEFTRLESLTPTPTEEITP